MSASPHAARLALALALAAWGCAAAPNPANSELQPVTPPAAPPAGEPATAEPPAGERAQAAAPAQEPRSGPPEQASASTESGAQDQTQTLTVGLVGGEPIDVRDFLSRLWMRDSQKAREVFEYLVMSRLAFYEADRLGVRMDPALVDATMERAYGALRAKLAETGSSLSLEEHVRLNMEMEPEEYDRKLRADAIVQLLTERCVRAWYLANQRVELVLTEFADDEALTSAREALAAGTAFADVAREHGVDADAAQGGTRMTVVRSETSDLARLAFSTPVGEIGGPLVQEGRFLLVLPERRLEPIEGSWAEVGELVEQSLRETLIDSDRLEYVQWRSAMMRRYPIDLGPFLDLVRDAAP